MADYQKIVEAKDRLVKAMQALSDELGAEVAAENIVQYGNELGIPIARYGWLASEGIND